MIEEAEQFFINTHGFTIVTHNNCLFMNVNILNISLILIYKQYYLTFVKTNYPVSSGPRFITQTVDKTDIFIHSMFFCSMVIFFKHLSH